MMFINRAIERITQAKSDQDMYVASMVLCGLLEQSTTKKQRKIAFQKAAKQVAEILTDYIERPARKIDGLGWYHTN